MSADEIEQGERSGRRNERVEMEHARTLEAVLPDESPLAHARLHRQLTVDEAARRASVSADEVQWLEEGRLYRFPTPDRALTVALLYATALGIDHRVLARVGDVDAVVGGQPGQAGLPALPDGAELPLLAAQIQLAEHHRRLRSGVWHREPHPSLSGRVRSDPRPARPRPRSRRVRSRPGWPRSPPKRRPVGGPPSRPRPDPRRCRLRSVCPTAAPRHPHRQGRCRTRSPHPSALAHQHPAATPTRRRRPRRADLTSAPPHTTDACSTAERCNNDTLAPLVNTSAATTVSIAARDRRVTQVTQPCDGESSPVTQ